MKYRLAWKNLETGQVGRGKPLFSSRYSASQVAIEMNAQWPNITHWAEEVSEEIHRPRQEMAGCGLGGGAMNGLRDRFWLVGFGAEASDKTDKAKTDYAVVPHLWVSPDLWFQTQADKREPVRTPQAPTPTDPATP